MWLVRLYRKFSKKMELAKVKTALKIKIWGVEEKLRRTLLFLTGFPPSPKREN